jgi:Mn-containing catalase
MQGFQSGSRLRNLIIGAIWGAKWELAAALRYFAQASGQKIPILINMIYSWTLLTEEFSHLEIVGATIQML